jgi:hypothetical protein
MTLLPRSSVLENHHISASWPHIKTLLEACPTMADAE